MLSPSMNKDSPPGLPNRDLKHVLEHAAAVWEDLRGASVFITGGSGFVGIWLLESLLHANDVLNLRVRVVTLTRRPDGFARRFPHLVGHPALELCPGDMADFTFPEGGFTHIIHAATTPYPLAAGVSLRAVFEHDLAGARRVLELAREKRVRRLLFTSSGAVYGRQPPELSHIPEDYTGAPSTLEAASGYGQAKRASEFLCVAAGAEAKYDVVIARLFAFMGPRLPLDSIFAAGNFVRDALRGGPIVIQGDGAPCRSYLYAADMAVWLWGLLLRGQAGEAYNVGSPDALSILDLARTVARAAGGIAPSGWPGGPMTVAGPRAMSRTSARSGANLAIMSASMSRREFVGSWNGRPMPLPTVDKLAVSPPLSALEGWVTIWHASH